MSKVHRLRALVQQRLTAAAEEIFVLFERTIAEYEEELSRSREHSNRGGLRLLPGEAGVPSLHPVECPQVKEEPVEQSAKHEEQLPALVPESSAVCVKSEESSLGQTELRAETQDSGSETEGQWERSDTEEEQGLHMETDEAQVQPEAQSPAADSVYLPSEQPLECPFCQSRMSTATELQLHLRVHTGGALKRFSCSVCDKRFADKSNLRSHTRTHTDEKPFSCSVCEKAFTRNSTLRLHMRIHTGEKPYSCPVCAKTFTRKDHLRSHKRTHRDADFSFQDTLQLFNL